MDLSTSMKAGAIHPEIEAWPFVDDPETCFTVSKRLIHLAEITHAIGVAVANITRFDTNRATAYARNLVLKCGANHTDGWNKPDRRAAARTKKHLLELVNQACKGEDEQVRRAALTRALGEWFRTESSAAPRTVTQGIKRADPQKLEQALTAAIAKAQLGGSVDAEVIIKAVWLSLGANRDQVANMFSYEDKRRKRSQSPDS
jgi:hypothetical protein